MEEAKEHLLERSVQLLKSMERTCIARFRREIKVSSIVARTIFYEVLGASFVRSLLIRSFT